MKVVKDFKDYQILDMADGQKLEKWNSIILNRPDPQIVWSCKSNIDSWNKVDAKYSRSNKGGGEWECFNKIPTSWQVNYDEMIFNLKLMGFKHTGLFPEQAINWKLVKDIIKNSKRKLKVLNLFAYTGAASVAALQAGAEVTHVDSSKGMVDWAKENVKSSNLEDKPIRFLVDDCKKFVKREIRRNSKYDIIIMDPPSFGRGSKNEVWDIEKDLYSLIVDCTEILSEEPELFLINSYTASLSKTVLENILSLTVNKKYAGNIESYELGLPMQNSNLILPCGTTAKWQKNTIAK